MRVFKSGVIIILIFYFFSIIADQIFDKKQAEKKFLILSKNMQQHGVSERRIILYGSSHCDYGLSAQKITVELNINTINLCNYGVERDKYKNGLLENLLNETTENDLIVYSFRLDLEKNQLEEDGILGLLLPQLRVAILKTIKDSLQNDKSLGDIGDFNKFGDRKYYPRREKPFNYIDYNINYELINKDINEKIYHLLNNEKLKSNVLFLVTPILIKAKSDINLSKIEFSCTKNICDKFVGLVQPILIDDMKYFKSIGPRHFNPELGRTLWTSELIGILKKLEKDYLL